ncbi:MAG: YfcE family phosphodiesterase [Treponema sp.]|jgi:putative phosphoesterase|nr:YfcE family phosphodiesterase [Treponema sp.]
MSGKLLVLSDIHGNIPAIVAVLRWAAGELADSDMAVFLGDGLRELAFAQQQTGFPYEWKKVRGNNDFMSTAPESDVFDFMGHRFYICHGHRHALYNSFDKLAACARNTGADAALFGHIHVPHLEDANGLLLVCPGGINRARSSAGETFALIECIPEKPLSVNFWGIDPVYNITELTIKKG